MCGIYGQSFRDYEKVKSALVKMQHRGPDEFAISSIENVQLGICRLAIINRDRTFQPYEANGNSVYAVFNGEIYNYKELIKKYALNINLEETDDGQFLIELFRLHGPRILYEIDGMFALGIYDSQLKRIYLARDKSGIKPLYYKMNSHKELVFASEIKALLPNISAANMNDNKALVEYFLVGHISSPYTYFSDIHSLMPGEVISYEIESKSISKVFNLNDNPRSNPRQLDEIDSVDLFDNLLTKSLQKVIEHGNCHELFFSGGLDSSLVAAIAKSNDWDLRLHKLDFLDSSWEKSRENELASRFANKLGYQFLIHELTVEYFAERVIEAYSAFGQPFAGVPSTFFLSEKVSEFSKTAISGDGADELFGSYRFALEMSEILQNRKNQNWSQNDFSRMLFETKIRNTKCALMTVIRKDKANKIEQIMKELETKYFGHLIQGREVHRDADLLNLALDYDAGIMLGNQVLMFSDHLGMQHSLELRPVFLSNDLLEFAKSLPSNQKISRDGMGKKIVKDLGKRYLPPEINYQVKEGFQSPIMQWMQTPHFVRHLSALYSDKLLGNSKLLDIDRIEYQVKKFLSGQSGNFFLIYKLWLLHSWLKVSA